MRISHIKTVKITFRTTINPHLAVGKHSAQIETASRLPLQNKHEVVSTTVTSTKRQLASILLSSAKLPYNEASTYTMTETSQSTPETTNWPALLRGSVLSSVQSKHVQYISLADRRAQVIITINAFLIPLILSGYKSMPEIRLGILVVVICAAFSIFFAVMSLMPKRFKGNHQGSRGLLHFSGIWGHNEAEYLEHMRVALDDRTTITEYMVSDIYHLSNDVLRPKFFWIRLSFYAFLSGLAASIILVVAPLFSSS